jgi:hypothetical protein
MSRSILIAGVALALAACGNNDQADNTQNVDENLSAENIVSNDVTAIDAVTGEAANMAAEVEMNEFDLNEMAAEANEAARTERPKVPNRPRPVEEATTNRD